MKGARDIKAGIWWILLSLVLLMVILFAFYLMGSNATRLLVMK